VRLEGLGKFKNHLVGYRTRDLPVCSIVPQRLSYRVPPGAVYPNIIVIIIPITKKKQIQTPRPESTSELHQPSERLLSANLVSNFADRGVSRSQSDGSPYDRNLDFQTGAATFLPSSSSIVLTRLSRPRSRPTTCQKIW
jgi:hypothetical protein